MVEHAGTMIGRPDQEVEVTQFDDAGSMAEGGRAIANQARETREGQRHECPFLCLTIVIGLFALQQIA